MRVGYAKIGRTVNLSPAKWGEVGGDNEPPILLNKLARRNPEHTFVLLGRNSGEQPAQVGLPDNVVNPFPEMKDEFRSFTSGNHTPMTVEEIAKTETGLHALMRPLYEELDAVILWAGQHGTSNARIPKIDNPSELTKPQDAFVYYVGYQNAGVNAWRAADPSRREVWLVPDVRNYLKGRDLAFPPGHLLGQYDFTKREKHYRYGDPNLPEAWGLDPLKVTFGEPGVWHAEHRYEYSQLEITGIPTSTPFSDDPSERGHFGIIVNENRAYVSKDRLSVMREWVMPLEPTFVHGKWSAKSLEVLQTRITSIPWHTVEDKIRHVRCTFTTPASGSGWATAKPWEAFAAGTVCFFHPHYDDQGWIIPTSKQLDEGRWEASPDAVAMARWLRTDTPEQLAKRVEALRYDDDAWRWLVQQQRRYFDAANERALCMTMIEERTGMRRA